MKPWVINIITSVASVIGLFLLIYQFSTRPILSSMSSLSDRVNQNSEAIRDNSEAIRDIAVSVSRLEGYIAASLGQNLLSKDNGTKESTDS